MQEQQHLRSENGSVSEAKAAAVPIRQTLPNPVATWGLWQARSTTAVARSSEAPVAEAVGSSEAPAAEAAGYTEVPAAACTEAAMAAENTWDARQAEASCAGPERWAAAAAAEPVARQERSPPDGLVRCMKLRARACWLASPDYNPELDERRAAIPER